MSRPWCICLVALATSFGPLAHISRADIVFTTFGAGQSYDATKAALDWQSGEVGVGAINDAVEFTPSRDFEFTQIDLALQAGLGSGPVTITVFGPGMLPSGEPGPFGPCCGGVDAGVSVSGIPAFTGSDCCPIQTITFPAAKLLTGQQYWIVLNPGAGRTAGFWMMNSTGATGETAFFPEPIAWQFSNGVPLPAFDVVGTPVPEPTSLLLLSPVVGAIWFARRKRIFFVT